MLGATTHGLLSLSTQLGLPAGAKSLGLGEAPSRQCDGAFTQLRPNYSLLSIKYYKQEKECQTPTRAPALTAGCFLALDLFVLFKNWPLLKAVPGGQGPRPTSSPWKTQQEPLPPQCHRCQARRGPPRRLDSSSPASITALG